MPRGPFITVGKENVFTSDEHSAYFGLLQYQPSSGAPIPQVVMYGDFGKDYDDVFALAILTELHDKKFINLRGVIANVVDAKYRARIARGVLDAVKCPNIPVGCGTDGSVDKTKMTSLATRFGSYEAEYVALEAKDDDRIEDGQGLMKRICEDAQRRDMKITLVLTSSLCDIAQFIKNERQLYEDAVGNHLIQGGYEIRKDKSIKVDEEAMNNLYDIESAKYFHSVLQQLQKPSSVFTREVAFAVRLPGDTFKTATDNIVAACLDKVQMKQEREFFERAFSKENINGKRGALWYLEGRTDYFRTHREEIPYRKLDDLNKGMIRKVGRSFADTK